MYLRSMQVHSERKKRGNRYQRRLSCKIRSGDRDAPPPPRPFSKRFPLMSLDGVEDFEIPAEVPERARISLTSSIFAYPGSRKIFGEIHGRTCRRCQPHIRESPGAPSPSGDDRRRTMCAREKTRALPSFPALTCRPFFFVPPAYRARFFKATHVLSMCDMPLKRHEAEGDTRVRCVYVSTFSRAIY